MLLVAVLLKALPSFSVFTTDSPVETGVPSVVPAGTATFTVMGSTCSAVKGGRSQVSVLPRTVVGGGAAPV